MTDTSTTRDAVRGGPDDDRPSSKDIYRRVLRTIDRNTFDGKPSMTERELATILSGHVGVPAKRVRSALQAAERNGDVLRWTDAERARVCLRTRQAVARLLNHERETDHPDERLIAACLDMLEDNDD